MADPSNLYHLPHHEEDPENLNNLSSRKGDIDGHLALTRWASPGTTRKSTAQARPGPTSILLVPGMSRL
jgi:hypothetical protein